MEVNETSIKVEVKEEAEEYEEYDERIGIESEVPARETVVFKLEEIDCVDPKEPIVVKQEEELIINDCSSTPQQFVDGAASVVNEAPDPVRDIIPVSISEGMLLLY